MGAVGTILLSLIMIMGLAGVAFFAVAMDSGLTRAVADTLYPATNCDTQQNGIQISMLRCVDTTGTIWMVTLPPNCNGGFYAVKIPRGNGATTLYSASGGAIYQGRNIQFLANATGVLALGNSNTGTCSPTTTTCSNFFKFSTTTWSGYDCNFTGEWSGYLHTARAAFLNSSAYIVQVIGTDCIYTKMHNGNTDTGYTTTGICGYYSFDDELPQMLVAGSKTGQTAGISSIVAMTTQNRNSIFQVACDVDITAFTSGEADCQVTYTDWNSGVQTKTLDAVTALGDVPGNSEQIMVLASTTITIKTTGVFVATYNVAGTITWYGNAPQ